MPERILTIEATDPHRFALQASNELLAIGFDAQGLDAALRGLRIASIRCEVVLTSDASPVVEVERRGQRSEFDLVEDGPCRLGAASFALEAAEDDEAATPEWEAEDEASTEPRYRLVVVNGADFGKSFPVRPITRIGRDRSADVVLNDLYVSQVHCQLKVADGAATIAHVDGSSGTLVNRQRIAGPTPVRAGDVVRVGNSHLRFEPAEASDAPAADAWSSEEPVRPRSLTPPPPTVSAPAAPPPKESTPFQKLHRLANTTFGHFQLGDVLGQGHFGVVFQAVDTKTGQTVALKALSPEFPRSDAELQQFGRAFKASLGLHDSHLVSLHGVGRTSVFTWISRDYVQGRSLDRIIEAEPKGDWRRACRVAAEIGAALDYLHQHKLVHGDLTPRDVLIRDEDGASRLADWLLAQALRGSRLERDSASARRDVDASYLAPERLAKPDATPDVAGDLYALGAICYEAATGHVPYAGDSAAAVLASSAAGPPARLSKRHKEIPGPFESAILRLLSVAPSARFADVGELLDVVEPIVSMYRLR